MTPAEWQSCDDPSAMLAALGPAASDRTLRRLAAACFRRLARLLPDHRQQQAIAALERMAAGTITAADLRSSASAARQAMPHDEGRAGGDYPYVVALMLYRELASARPAVHALHAAAGVADGEAERAEQARLVREFFRSPNGQALACPPPLTPTVRRLALAARQAVESEGGVLDNASLAVLSDALEEEGSSDEELLAHLRDHGPHLPGCWAITWVLGEEATT